MSKTNTVRKSNPANEVEDLQDLILATEIKLSNSATALQTLSKNTSIPASEFVSERNRLTGEIADLREELEVLEERLDAARLQDAKRAHEAKCNHVALVLKRRLALMTGLDAALEKAAEAAREIIRIDSEELAPDIAGIDQRFPIGRKEFVHIAANRLASLGLGTDRRLDTSVPVPTLTDHSAAQHKLILTELAEKAPKRVADIPPSRLLKK